MPLLIDAQREVDCNIAGFLGFVTYDPGRRFYWCNPLFSITSADSASLHAGLNIPPNPASTQEVPMALYDCFRVARPLAAPGG